MNPKEAKYTQFALVREMLDLSAVVEKFDPHRADDTADIIAKRGRLLLTGEGSSRIFPAKNAARKALAWGLDLQIVTEGARQAATYDLSKFAVFAASNSGRTSEVIALLKQLQAAGHAERFGLTANEQTVLESVTTKTYVLQCGWEEAVAATKSAAEQALFYQALVSRMAGSAPKRLARVTATAAPVGVVNSASGPRA